MSTNNEYVYKNVIVGWLIATSSSYQALKIIFSLRHAMKLAVFIVLKHVVRSATHWRKWFIYFLNLFPFFFFVIISLLQILNIFKEENLLVGIRSNAFETFPSMSMTILWIELSTEKFICVCSLKLYFSAIFIW